MDLLMSWNSWHRPGLPYHSRRYTWVCLLSVGEISFSLVPRTEEEIQKLMGLAESLKTPALQDEVIREAILEQGEKVLKGEAAPEEAAEAVTQKVNLYLAE